MQQAQLFETADERGCTPMFGAAHRREGASAVPHPRRYEVARYRLRAASYGPVIHGRDPRATT